ncbi:hypothetical protein OS493_029293 [Desmophyllum pertusum]|uniref:Uncharacterized protein n=1 Tax=Desmophyllum pertusum TaxID=174260 RepID=A0A9W9Z9T0_9CNID|nr:hypothetical protein OS493_029293 [Desmophyllum pertusum]
MRKELRSESFGFIREEDLKRYRNTGRNYQNIGESDDSDNDDASVMASPHSPQPDTSAGQDLSGLELSPDSAKKLAALAHEPQRRKDFLGVSRLTME